jgi:hypothetical protein
LNEYGWLKRRDHYHKAYHRDVEEGENTEEAGADHHMDTDDYDEVLTKLK